MASPPHGLPFQELAQQLGTDAARLAATAGEDYELCVCLPPAVRTAGQIPGWRDEWGELTWVGQVRPGTAAVSFGADEPELRGYEHLT